MGKYMKHFSIVHFAMLLMLAICVYMFIIAATPHTETKVFPVKDYSIVKDNSQGTTFYVLIDSYGNAIDFER